MDYKNGNFYIAGTEEKTITEASIEFFSSALSSLVIGKYEKQLKSAFKDTDPKYTKEIIEQFVKFGNEYIKEILSNGLVEKYKAYKENKEAEQKNKQE